MPDHRSSELLYQARLAMREGKYDDAEQLIGQADQARGTVNPLTSRFKRDSPDRARRALAALREANPATRPTLSRYTTPTPPSGARPANPGILAVQGDAKTQSRAILLAARQALAAGNAASRWPCRRGQTVADQLCPQ